MAQLIVTLVDQTSPDVYLDVKLHKRGDVIEVVSDEAQLSKAELNNPDWRVLKFTGMSVSEASVMLAAEPALAVALHPAAEDRMLQKRAFYLDLDDSSLPMEMKVFFTGTAGLGKVLTVPREFDLSRLKRARAKRSDPFVIG